MNREKLEPKVSSCERKTTRGGLLLFTLAVLMILFTFVLSLLLLFKFGERTFFKMMSGREAMRHARAGLEQAIWELDHDSQECDSYLDSWRTVFSGEDVDNDGDGTPDSRWFPILDRQGRLIGRYAVLVEDENGKINLNACGNVTGSFNQGHSVAEISLLPQLLGRSLSAAVVRFRYGADGLPGVADQDDDRDQMLLSSDGIDNDGDGLVDEEGEGIDEPDEFSIRWPRGGDRPYIIPQDLRLVPGCSEKLFWQVQPFLSTFSVDFNENRQKVTRLNLNQASFDDFFELFKRLGYEKFHAAQLAANSIDFRDKDSLPTVVELDGHKIIGVEKVPAFNEVEAVVPFEIKEIPIGLEVAEKAGQFIEIFNPYPEDLDIGGWKITGVVTVPLSVLNVLLKESRTVYDDVTRGETQVDAGRIRDLLEAINPTSILIPPGTVLKAHSYYTIGDLVRLVIIIPVEGTPFPLVLPLRDPDGCQQYEPILVLNPAGSEKFSIFLRKLPFLEKLGFDFTLRLYDNHDQLIEEARYPVDTPWTTVQKNDPRMRGTLDWFPFEGSPGQQNSVFQPWVSGEFGKVGWVHLWPSSFCVKNRSFSTIAELSFVHRQQQWRTLDFWRTGEDRAILDEVTVVARPALATLGRLNVNTASETVLLCLPLFSPKLTERLLASRPFRDISEILGQFGQGSSPGEELNREITRFGFDLMDNNGDGYLDDEAEKELVFSKVVGLITVRSNIFSVTVTGQKVADRNGNGKIEEKEVAAEKKFRAVYDRRRKKVMWRQNL